jgi:hypothetical protein
LNIVTGHYTNSDFRELKIIATF